MQFYGSYHENLRFEFQYENRKTTTCIAAIEVTDCELRCIGLSLAGKMEAGVISESNYTCATHETQSNFVMIGY